MSEQRKKKDERTEAERIDGCLSGEHDPDLDVEMPDYMRQFAEDLRRRDRPAK